MNNNNQIVKFENSLLWSLKVVAGVLIIGILGIHFVVNHLVAPEGLLTYKEILRYYQYPIVPVMEIAFLIFVVVHALLGLRSIFLDLHLNTKFKRGIDAILIMFGVVAIGYGSWLVVKVVQLGSG